MFEVVRAVFPDDLNDVLDLYHEYVNSTSAENRPNRGVTMMRWAALLLLALPAVVLAKTEPEFHLCLHYVEDSAVGEQTDLGWPVYVKLSDVGARSLEAFTEANTGRMVRILVGSREFSRATVRAPVSGGDLHRTFSAQEHATDWQRTFAEELPEAPCGAPHTGIAVSESLAEQ